MPAPTIRAGLLVGLRPAKACWEVQRLAAVAREVEGCLEAVAFVRSGLAEASGKTDLGMAHPEVVVGQEGPGSAMVDAAALLLVVDREPEVQHLDLVT